MRIVILSVFHPYRGGIAQFNRKLASELAKKHEVKRFNYTLQYPSLLFPGKSQYVNSEDLDHDFHTSRTLSSINPLSWIKTANTIKKEKPDILILRFWIPFLAPASGFVARRVKKSVRECRVITILDNLVPHEKRIGDKALTKYLLNRSDEFFVMSDQVKNNLRDFLPRAMVRQSPHPIFDQFENTISRKESREHFGFTEKDKVILFFGFIRKYKGLDILIKALSKTHEDITLLIGGECYGSIDEYKRLIKEFGLEDRVILHNDFIDNNSVQKYFNAADLCTLPYRSATQSGIIPIALHFQLAVLSTNVGGLKEYITNGEDGLVVESCDDELIAESINLYFSDKDLRNRIKLAWEKTSKKFSWENFSQEVIRSN